MRETEILFFLLVVIMIRSRKTGSTALVAYLSNGFVYAKGANIILFFLADPRLCMVYLILAMLQVWKTFYIQGVSKKRYFFDFHLIFVLESDFTFSHVFWNQNFELIPSCNSNYIYLKSKLS